MLQGDGSVPRGALVRLRVKRVITETKLGSTNTLSHVMDLWVCVLWGRGARGELGTFLDIENKTRA